MIDINKRFDFIDCAKAFGILLICIGHFLQNGLAVKTALYCFHVPVFFVISGFLFKQEVRHPLSYIGKTAKRVLIPYCGWFLIAVLRYIGSLSRKRIKSLIIDFFMLDGLPVWNQPIWFIPVFFVAVSLFCLVVYALQNLDDGKRNLWVGILAFLCFGVAVLCDHREITKVPFGLNKTIMMLGYVSVGFLLRQFFEKYEVSSFDNQKKRKLSVICVIVFALFFVTAAMLNRGDNISVMSCDFNNIFAYIPLSIVGSCSFLLMFLPAKPRSFISRISSSTIFIMGSHYFLRFWWRNSMPDTVFMDVLGGVLAICLLIGVCFVLEWLSKRKYNKLTIPFGWLGFVPMKR